MSSSSSHFSILQITDPHILATPEATLLGVNTAHYFNAVLEHAFRSNRKFDLCLLTGDLAQDPCLASYKHILNKLETYNIPCICLPGNHDNFDIMQAVFCTEQVNCRKQIVLENWQIVSLNSQIPGSAGGYLSDKELVFLGECLSENSELNTLIAVHHHCLPTESLWMDTMMIENALEFFDLFKPYPNVKTIINGHIHQAMDVQVDSVRILTTPSTCFQFKPLSERFSLDDTSPGYRWINLYADGSMDSDIVRLTEPLKGIQANTQGY
ncbi:MAG: 3',5'-cyclic-AMP phosphodiesterase [Proteobacteria bacterium]|nr:3',5'-cyclic-AMP phosphodiesterase [Pseudomonadota bacterium]